MSGLSRRRWMAAAAAGWFAAVRSRAARAASDESTREWPVAGFDALAWHALDELRVEQSGRERLVVVADPEVLAKVVAEVRDRTLHIGFTSGTLRTQRPIVFRVEVKTLSALDLDGAGQAQIGLLAVPALTLRLRGSVALRLAALRAERLDARLDGSGALHVDGGAVQRQRIVLAGAGRYDATALASREADVAIEGSGHVKLSVAERLAARIAGSGEVSYRGAPQVSRRIDGAGRIVRDDAAG